MEDEVKRMFLELTKFTDKQLGDLRFACNEEVGARNSNTLRKMKPNVRAKVPMNKCVLQQNIDGVWLERKLTEEPE
jgi:hypothetical protein